MFAAISGLKNHQVMLDVTANDISNVNTIGYKSARTTFKDALSQMQRAAAAPSGTNGGSNAVQIGLGVALSSVDNLMGTGALQSTGNNLDVAIQGAGFFRVSSSPTPYAEADDADQTTVEYTRAGNFTTNTNGQLVTQDGYYVLGVGRTDYTVTPAVVATATERGPITVPKNASNVAIAENGEVSGVINGERQVLGIIQLSTFANSAGLERSASNRWKAGTNSGEPVSATPDKTTGLLMAGAIEMSNVDLATTFTSMITAQRGFQANSRVISTSDEMLQDLVNLKR
jgi:flagellar hook protein FlgE